MLTALFMALIEYTLYNEENNWRDMPLARNEGDGGGLTRLGLTTKYDSDAFPPGKGINDLTLKDFKEIYFKKYWHPLYDHILAKRIAFRLFDFGVNRYPTNAVRALQEAVNECLPGGRLISEDGHFGPETLHYVNFLIDDCKAEAELYASFIARCRAQYDEIVEKHPEKAGNYDGWIARLEREFKY